MALARNAAPLALFLAVLERKYCNLEETRNIFLCSKFASAYLLKKPRQKPPRRNRRTSGRDENSSCRAWNRWRTGVGKTHSIISVYDAVGRSARPNGFRPA